MPSRFAIGSATCVDMWEREREREREKEREANMRKREATSDCCQNSYQELK